MSPVVVENLERDMAVIKERYGDHSVHRASEEPPIFKIPLESPGLMRITSGGIPMGRVTRLWGSPSSGKTLCALAIVRAAHNFKTVRYMNGLEAMYWNVEGAFDREYARSLGVDIERLRVRETDIIEHIGRDMQLVLGSVHLHIIDSCSEAKSESRMEKDLSEADTLNSQIRAWEKAFDYITNAMDKDENAIVTIDHEKSRFTTTGRPGPAKALGGKEMEHLSGLSIQFSKGSWLYHDADELLQTEDKFKDKSTMGIAGQKEADGIEILARVNKSRVCRPFRYARMRLDFKKNAFDYSFELMDAALYFDEQGGLAHKTMQPPIAKKAGSWFTLLNGDKIQGEKQLRERIDQDKDLQDTIKKAMMAGN